LSGRSRASLLSKYRKNVRTETLAYAAMSATVVPSKPRSLNKCAAPSRSRRRVSSFLRSRSPGSAVSLGIPEASGMGIVVSIGSGAMSSPPEVAQVCDHPPDESLDLACHPADVAPADDRRLLADRLRSAPRP